MSSTQPSKKERRREELQRREKLNRQRAKRRLLLRIGIGALLLVAIGVGIFAYSRLFAPPSFATAQNTASDQANTPAPLVSDNPVYPVINNISCSKTEQLSYHVHSHLSIYINGQAVPVSENIGIAPDQSCLYWLHTHDTSGVIHMEAPQKDSFQLGTFLRLWREQFSNLQYPTLLSTTEGWQVYVDGQLTSGDFNQIELKTHTLITMVYNSPDVKPDTSFSWGLLNE